MTYIIRGKQFEAIERSVWSLAEAGQWEPETFDVLDKYIVPGKVFIDIGAWVGVLSLYAESLGAEVYAIEADMKAANEFRENILNSGSKIHLHWGAIADKSGYCEINTTNEWGNSESSLIERKGIKEEQKIVGLTIEDFILNHNVVPLQNYYYGNHNICLIKMDVEGSEVMILKQAASWLKKYKPTMWISFHPGLFENLDKDIQMIIDVLFPIYDCMADYEDFAEILYDPNAFHTFLFKAK